MSTNLDWLRALHGSLNQRQMPENVAQLIIDGRSDLSGPELAVLQKAAGKSFKGHIANWFSSMPAAFKQPYGMRKQLTKAEELFHTTFSDNAAAYHDVAAVEVYLKLLSAMIGKQPGKSDFKADRLNTDERKKHGLDLSKRQYNKLFRHHGRLEAKLQTLIREQRKLRFTKISKASLASDVTWEDFSQDMPTACFIAYYAARAYRRSMFTAYGQEKAYDEIADSLFQQAAASPTANWWAIAHVYPKPEVIAKLSDEQKGELLGKWTGVLQDVASLLEEIWQKSNIDRASMVVRQGNDSTTWNQTAGAWNKARDNWVALVYSMGMADVLHTLCFGKVMRLIAGDVAYMHRAVGGDLDPDTKVWNDLPLPWEVFHGQASCTIDTVYDLCRQYGVDPEKSGWVAPRPRTFIEQYKPTPELVHGVIVESPFLAKVLRDAGFFSGKQNKVTAIGDAEAMDGLHDEVLEKHHQQLKPDDQ